MFSLNEIPRGERRRPWLRLLADRQGSYTLEAALVFPVIVLATFMVLFFALYIAQGAIAYYGASVAGERAAFNWSNSAKDSRTSAYPEGSYDGLYWRLTDDAVLAGLFGSGVSQESDGAELAGDGVQGHASDALTTRKLGAAMEAMDAAIAGQMIYENELLVRRIRAEAKRPDGPDPLVRFRGGAPGKWTPTAVVVEPAEFIRTFDLIRYYAAKMKGSSDGGGSLREKAKSVLIRRRSEPGG